MGVKPLLAGPGGIQAHAEMNGGIAMSAHDHWTQHLSADVDLHPCFSERAHRIAYRMHLPVAPVCNAECAFCMRTVCSCQNAPGCASQLLKPQEAVSVFRRIEPRLTSNVVVGVAGPGDALASDHALETFRLLPARTGAGGHLVIKCLSTNGIELAPKAAEVAQAGVSFVTVSMHSVDPVTASVLVPRVLLGGTWRSGRDAAGELISRQLDGIRAAADLGLVVKVNVVVVKDVNLQEVEEIALAARTAGASVINPIPVIPSMGGALRPPTGREMQDVYARARAVMSTFTMCKHCRADACGVPGGEDGLIWSAADDLTGSNPAFATRKLSGCGE